MARGFPQRAFFRATSGTFQSTENPQGLPCFEAITIKGLELNFLLNASQAMHIE